MNIDNRRCRRRHSDSLVGGLGREPGMKANRRRRSFPKNNETPINGSLFEYVCSVHMCSYRLLGLYKILSENGFFDGIRGMNKLFEIMLKVIKTRSFEELIYEELIFMFSGGMSLLEQSKKTEAVEFVLVLFEILCLELKGRQKLMNNAACGFQLMELRALVGAEMKVAKGLLNANKVILKLGR